jgi:lactoylglutathione lyase
MLKLRIVAFIVPSVPTTVAFYSRAFGLPLHFMHPTQGYAELNSGPAVLAFLGEEFVANASLLGKLPVYPNRPDAPALGAHVALWSDDIDADWQRAVNAGASVVVPLEQKPWGQIAGYLRDPDGVVVELCTPSPREMPV